MDDTEFRHADRQFFVATVSTIKDQAVARTVHRLEAPFFLLNVKREHVVLVVLPVARCFPQLTVEHVGRDDLLVPSFGILALSKKSDGERATEHSYAYPKKLY